MFLVTGNFGKKNYVEEQLTLSQLQDLFPDVQLPEGNTAVFASLKKNKPAGYNLTPTIEGAGKDGTPINIRYFSTRAKAKDGYNYLPAKIPFLFSNVMETVDLTRRREIAFFFLLHHKCTNSPLKQFRGVKEWKLFDALAVASDRKKAILAKVELQKQIREIYEANPEHLWMIASGSKIKGLHLDTKSADGAFTSLYDGCEKHEKAIRELLTDDIALARGTINRALATKKLLKTVGQNGVTTFFFPDQTEFLKTPKGSDSVQIAAEYYLANADTYEEKFK